LICLLFFYLEALMGNLGPWPPWPPWGGYLRKREEGPELILQSPLL
jgi:hypothetical protein